MKTTLTYGFTLALIGFVLALIFYIAGFHSSGEKFESISTLTNCLMIVVSIVVLFLAMKAKRAVTPADQPWGYGSALGTGVMTALYAALIGLVLTYVYFAFINSNMSEVIFQAQVAKMEAKGMTADQIERAEPMMRKMMTPAIASIFSSVGGFVFNVILALIIAIFVRSRPATVPAAA